MCMRRISLMYILLIDQLIFSAKLHFKIFFVAGQLPNAVG